MLDAYSHFFFVGIAGTGMSAIAQYLRGKGKEVSGSDRLFGQEQKLLSETQFEAMGINCYFQDGRGITPDVDVVVVSTAIEETNVEYQKALQLNIPIMKRSAILAEISNSVRTIAVGGTSGKSTTTAMVFHIMEQCGKSPSLITGAGLSVLQEKGLPGNAWVGKSDWLVIESDESDGSIGNYKPEISLLLNIDRDHKEYDELEQLFSTFRDNTKSFFIANQDYALTKKLSQSNNYNFGTVDGAAIRGTNFKQEGFSISFDVNGVSCTIPAIGKHNMENALAAIAATSAAGISIEESTKALATFRGIYRRAQLVGKTKNNCYVIDDFAHNPAEVAAVTSGTATLETAYLRCPQVVCYQLGGGVLFYKIMEYALRHIRYVSLVNLLLDGFSKVHPLETPAVTELLGYKLSVQSLHAELVKVCGESAARARMLRHYERMSEILGEPGAPVRAAKAILERLN